ncbi:MAG: beta-phosphoglucomutase [Candidatus Borkfalkiaceae bacterium]|nr:beta-phosphoglucomutase [bacterium]MDY2850502.1 beta-phosphoglucomutase [Christensenellaceae bacterium]
MKGIIFDLDGVIVSTDKLHYAAWKKMADDESIYFDEQINNRLRGVSRMASLEIILEKANKTYTDEEKLALAEKKNNLYRELLKELTPADRLPGVTKTLDELKARGFKLAIGSSSKNTPQILKYIGLDGFFDAVSDGNNITHSKPDPEVFLKASEMLGLSPEDCYIVEDSTAGIEAGLAGGFSTIGIGDAALYERTLYKIRSFDEILGIVK